ncbi:unnamed protein product [Adineta ricciae]|uniref:Lipoprotein n=1 Tax=Adineta ricciae TaxID=249248 RepID=A0A815D2G5_ADIRI|nr:unnamed protein product [Adineta ricciae]
MLKKLILFLLLSLILAIKCAKSETAVRSYVVKEDKPPTLKPLTDFTAYDSREKDRIYLLRTTSSDIDTITLFDYRARTMIGNVEGEWINGIFNVSLSIYDPKSDKWVDGIMTLVRGLLSYTYKLNWNNQRLVMKSKSFTKTIKIYDESTNQLMGQFRYRSFWRSGTKYKYDVKIFTNKLPDAIFLLSMTVVHHSEKLVDDKR